jgi:TorA maturation chaperone TorD
MRESCVDGAKETIQYMKTKSPNLFLLETRVFLYAVLAASLRSEPSSDVLEELSIRISSLKSDMANRLQPALRRSIDALLTALASATPEVLVVDYADLFLAGKNGWGAPSESSYLEGLLYGNATMDVIERYAQFGFVKEPSFTEPCDHIALECAFMAALGMELAAHASSGNRGELKRLVDAQSNFLQFHMARWVPGWAEKVKETAGTDFYKAVADLACSLIAADRDLLARIAGATKSKETSYFEAFPS